MKMKDTDYKMQSRSKHLDFITAYSWEKMNFRVISGVQGGQGLGFQEVQLLLALDEGWIPFPSSFTVSLQPKHRPRESHTDSIVVSHLHFTEKESGAKRTQPKLH